MTALERIKEKIRGHKDAIKLLEKEMEEVQDACPHPESLVEVLEEGYPSREDDYGCYVSGKQRKTRCSLCDRHFSRDVRRGER